MLFRSPPTIPAEPTCFDLNHASAKDQRIHIKRTLDLGKQLIRQVQPLDKPERFRFAFQRLIVCRRMVDGFTR
jgi:hypothetical protein